MHYPVLREEVLSYLAPAPGNVILDATLGGGGHASDIIDKITPGGRLIALDRDIEAIERARDKFADRINDVIFINEDFGNIASVLRQRGIEKIDGAVFDLGLSSFQLDDPSRGFSFMNDGPLDMRFDRLGGITAYEVVNSYGKEELAGLIRDFGEERHYRLIASAIVNARKRSKISTTRELVSIIGGAVGKKYSGQRIHPSCRTFQALRIHVNNEMSSLETGVYGAVSLISPGKRICVISFHSLEDRIVKNIFRKEAKLGVLRIITKKPVVPGSAEIRVNSRSRSAKLRVAEGVK